MATRTSPTQPARQSRGGARTADIRTNPAETPKRSGRPNASPRAAGPPIAASATLSDRQRRTLFALARSLRLSHAELRGLTPADSIARLTPDQANTLIARMTLGRDHLPALRPMPVRGRARPASPGQLRLIGELARSTGVSDDWWLRFKVSCAQDVRTLAQARRIIGALVKIQRKADPRPETPRPRPPAQLVQRPPRS